MSIKTNPDTEDIPLPGIWTVLIKAALIAFPIVFGGGLTISAWLITKSFEHDSRIAVLEYASRRAGEHSGQTTSVNVGQAEPKDIAAKFRDYYTTEEVASLLKLAPRTVQGLCEAGQLPAVKDGREWHIAKDFQLSGSQPLTAATSGELPSP